MKVVVEGHLRLAGELWECTDLYLDDVRLIECLDALEAKRGTGTTPETYDYVVEPGQPNGWTPFSLEVHEDESAAYCEARLAGKAAVFPTPIVHLVADYGPVRITIERLE